jgi:hypothetical protein
MRNLLALVALVFVAGLVFGMIDGRTTTPEKMRRVLVKECVDENASRLRSDRADAFCGCMVDKLMTDHTFEELKVALRTEGPTPSWVKEEHLRDARQCAARLELQINVH